MIDLNRLKELEKKAEHAHVAGFKGDRELFYELRNALPDLIRELEAGRKVIDNEPCLCTTCGDTWAGSCHEEALAVYRKARGDDDN